ncbi:MAG: hypothetical protein JOY80_07460, partial [Candidatus Dormibacteraeota bacterium]|nr:hypothetical protein [Candidatus Dormibacteraeota bacterium]
TRHTVLFVLVVVLGGFLGATLDPAFGLNLRTVSLAAGVGLALTLCAAIYGVAEWLYRRSRGEDAHWQVRALPSGLLVTAVGVLVSRLTNFEPGYLYGLILIASFSGELSTVEEGRGEAAGAAALIVFSIGAWLVWTPVHAAAQEAGAAGGLVFLQDMLTAIFVIGIVRAVVCLLPLRFLPGQKVARWSRSAWSLLFGLGVFAFTVILLRRESAVTLESLAPIVLSLSLFVGFGLASVLFWAYFRYCKPNLMATTDSIIS